MLRSQAPTHAPCMRAVGRPLRSNVKPLARRVATSSHASASRLLSPDRAAPASPRPHAVLCWAALRCFVECGTGSGQREGAGRLCVRTARMRFFSVLRLRTAQAVAASAAAALACVVHLGMRLQRALPARRALRNCSRRRARRCWRASTAMRSRAGAPSCTSSRPTPSQRARSAAAWTEAKPSRGTAAVEEQTCTERLRPHSAFATFDACLRVERRAGDPASGQVRLP